MSDPSDFVSGTIDDLLLSMAEGLVHAQEQLNQLQTVDALGRPGPTYQVPYLDFDLRVTAQFVTDPTLDQKYRASMLSPGGSRHLVMRAIQPSDTTIDGFKGEIVSNLRGRFVAVPPNAGKPPLVISTTVEQLDPQHHALRVLVRTALGEPLPGLQVHYNLDSALSIALSAADGPGPDHPDDERGHARAHGHQPRGRRRRGGQARAPRRRHAVRPRSREVPPCPQPSSSVP
jgi:hypothetical protein